MTKCKICGNAFEPELPHHGLQKTICPECTKDKAALFYAYNAIRYELWRCVSHNQVTAIKIYKDMCTEEDEEWAQEVLGEKLTAAILALL